MQTAQSSALTITLPSEKEILLTRVFDAPRELVFAAMTMPEHVARWWGPHGSVMELCEMDCRPGGHWQYILRCNGKEVRFRGVYHEIVPPERLVTTECYVEPRVGSPEWHTTLTLEEIDGKTIARSRVLHSSATNRDAHLNAGMERGASETYDRLAELLAFQSSGMEREVEIVRIFNAPRELVYRAWTEPEHMTQWWGPTVFTNHSCELDVKPGGKWQIAMRSPAGVDHYCKGIYSEVREPERLVFTNDAFDADGKPLLQGFTTVILEPQGEKTKLTLRTRAIGLVEFAPQMLRGMEQGWSQSLDKLLAHVANS